MYLSDCICDCVSESLFLRGCLYVGSEWAVERVLECSLLTIDMSVSVQAYILSNLNLIFLYPILFRGAYFFIKRKIYRGEDFSKNNNFIHFLFL